MPDLPSTPMQDEANVHAEPLVSVIMNCYNGEQYLRDAINSVIGQTYQNWELIFWDNQSTDHSAATFMSYADPRLRYFYAPSHTVLYDARNHAVSKSRGEFLAFLDVDDWWTTDKLTAQIGLFADETVGLVYGNFWIARNGDRLKLAHHKRLPEGNVLNQLIEHYCVGLLTIVVRRSAFESLSYPFDSRYRMIGDMDLAVRLAVNWDFAAIQRPLAFYRLHGNNESIRGFGCAIKEHENWYCEATNHPHISKQISFVNGMLYTKGLYALNEGRRADAFNIFYKLPMNMIKVRLLAFIVISMLPIRWNPWLHG